MGKRFLWCLLGLIIAEALVFGVLCFSSMVITESTISFLIGIILTIISIMFIVLNVHRLHLKNLSLIMCVLLVFAIGFFMGAYYSEIEVYSLITKGDFVVMNALFVVITLSLYYLYFSSLSLKSVRKNLGIYTSMVSLFLIVTSISLWIVFSNIVFSLYTLYTILGLLAIVPLLYWEALNKKFWFVYGAKK